MFVFLLLGLESLKNMFWIQVLFQICTLQIFPSSLWIIIFLAVSFAEQRFLYFDGIQFISFFKMDWAFGMVSKKSLSHPMWQRFPLEISYFYILNRSQHTFSVKSHMVNIFSFVGLMVSVTTTRLHCHSSKAATNNM